MIDSSTTLLTPEQTAKILGVEIPTLANWRCTKRQKIPYVRIGRSIRYPEKSVKEFIQLRIVN